MSDNEIIVCTTMRDFKGSDNDLIQLKFLNSLKTQEKVKIRLVVTLFGEKKVPEIVYRIFEDAIIYDGTQGDYKYSHTQVINNAIDFNKKENKVALPILWTTCDVIYDKDFISKCFPYLQKKSIVTSHPHKIIDLQNPNDKNRIDGLDSGFDVLIFSSRFVSDNKFTKSLNHYVNKDWGVYEQFLISLNELIIDSKLYNIYEESVVSKILNNRKLTNEPNKFMIESYKRNSQVFLEFLKNYSLNSNYFKPTYCHLKFIITKNSLQHYSRFLGDLIYYFFTLKFMSLASKVTPEFIKNLIKRRKRKY